jgi:hypothetical protein
MIQIIKEFLMMFIILFLVISGLLFGWSAVHGQSQEKTISYPINPDKSRLILTQSPAAHRILKMITSPAP